MTTLKTDPTEMDVNVDISYQYYMLLYEEKEFNACAINKYFASHHKYTINAASLKLHKLAFNMMSRYSGIS